MKRKIRLGLLLLLLALLVTACGKKEEEETGYTLYYRNLAGTRLVEEKYSPTAETFEEMMDELLAKLQTAPTGSESVILDEVEVLGYERGIDALRIDFSGTYYDLSSTDEVLLRAAVVKTFCQVPGVTKVMITVNQEQLHDQEGELVQAMDADSFIDTKEGGINSYQYAKLSLYFANQDGTYLVKETRNLHYSSNMVLERVIVEQLIQGPEDSELQPVFTTAVKIQNVQIKNGICTINLDGEANREPTESEADAELALYAVVHSICETCDDITGVRFEIEGDGSATFREQVDLDQVFLPEDSYVEEHEFQSEAAELLTETEAVQTETEGMAETEQETTGEGGTSPVVGVDPSLSEG